MFRYETCHFCKQNCKLQKMCNGSGLHTSGEGAGFLEDFGGLAPPFIAGLTREL